MPDRIFCKLQKMDPSDKLTQFGCVLRTLDVVLIHALTLDKGTGRTLFSHVAVSSGVRDALDGSGQV